MWGFQNKLNRSLANFILNRALDREINKKLIDDYGNYGPDQMFLSRYIFNFTRNQSIIHTSYHCEKWIESRPFPTKRFGY